MDMLNPNEAPRSSHVAQCLAGDVPVIAASDYVKTLPEQLRGSIQRPIMYWAPMDLAAAIRVKN